MSGFDIFDFDVAGELAGGVTPGGVGAALRRKAADAQHAAGTPKEQAKRLAEVVAVLSSRETASRRFPVGSLVMVDPDLLDVYPHHYPAPGYPAIITAHDPGSNPSIFKPMTEHGASTEQVDCTYAVLLQGRGTYRVLNQYFGDSRWFIPWDPEKAKTVKCES